MKKCKNALASSKSATLDVSYSEESQTASSSWYIENQIVDNLNRCEINELEEIFEDAQISINAKETSSVYQVANIVEVRGPSTTESSASESGSDKKEAVDGSSQKETQDEKDGSAPNDNLETNSPILMKSQDEDDVTVSKIPEDEEEKEEEDMQPVSVNFLLFFIKREIPAR